MYVSRKWLAAMVLVCAGALSSASNAPAQPKVTEVIRTAPGAPETKVIETLAVRRYQLYMTGSGNSFIMVDTATGRCWLSSPDKREWLDIGAPPPAPRPTTLQVAPAPAPTPAPVVPPKK
jgi:hypothetical protein